jgi:hypothetical protein
MVGAAAGAAVAGIAVAAGAEVAGTAVAAGAAVAGTAVAGAGTAVAGTAVAGAGAAVGAAVGVLQAAISIDMATNTETRHNRVFERILFSFS